MRQEDGATLREHLESLERQTKEPQPQLEGPEFPEIFRHVWDWFWELHAARGGNGFAANPITYLEIRAWSEMTGHEPTNFEVTCLVALDQAYRATSSTNQKAT